ncbi:MAG TPA: PBS lyase [Synergistaceae bacterium]|jgi:epoxyqueuosine reductase|nr:PBS lyase [Synergistaceae bacterium]
MKVTDIIKRKGLELGFSHIGITTAEPFIEYAQELLRRPDYAIWADPDRSKYPGRTYLTETATPKNYYPQGTSIICATLGYSQYLYPEELTRHVARAYLCRSYVPQPNDLAGIRVAEYKRFIKSLGIGMYEGECDLPQRAACARAGIITYGKNNFAYTKEDGSFNILFTFLVDTVLDYDEPTVRCDCPESCHKCIDACPSQAIAAPGRLLPRNCAMNNHQLPLGAFPDDLWDKFSTSIHGCDICQLACPRNAAVLKRASRKDPFLETLKDEFDLEKVLFLDEDYYETAIRPIMYNYIRDMDLFRRNAAIAMGNSGNSAYITPLEKALTVYKDKPELLKPIVWALGRLRGEEKSN